MEEQFVPKVAIDVIGKSDPARGVDWGLDIKDKKYDDGGKINLKRGDGRHEITFTMQDPDGLGLRFDASCPMWMIEGTTCPTSHGIHTRQVTVDSCNARDLVILDRNEGQPVDLCFRLNITDGTGQPCPYDPIIKNGGG